MTRLGPYELLEEVGKGGMATVYRAYQASVDRHVAVKVIHKNIMGDEVTLERFRREARLIARLEHPHIMPVYDFDGMSDPPYIVMRYVDSGTLKDVMNRQRLPLDDIGFLLRQTAAALDYAHEQGIVHRDIKPSNIMLDKQGNIIVSDFGIARLSDSKQSGSITGTGAAIGTPDYMSPEQVMGNVVDGRADTYALGVTLFQLLTGNLPYTGDSAMAVMMKHVQEKPPRVTDLNSELPAAIDDVILRALAKNPQDRFDTAGELAAAVVEALGGAMLNAPPVLSQAAQTTAMGIKKPSLQPDTDSKSTPSEQHKIVTVLAGNAADYHDMMIESRGAEAARVAVQRLGERIQQIVSAREGQFIEEGEHSWLAVWGAVSTHEDDIERALNAALDMQAALRELGMEVITESDDEPLPLKIGVHTGLALLTPNKKQDAVTVTGTAITLAQKLAETADGLIRISPDTFRSVEGVFDIVDDLPLKLRGRKDPLPTYHVIAAKARAFRARTYSVAGVETRMVGREAEFKQLQNAYLNAFEENETQAVTVLGESGLGKSRLLSEFDKWSELRPETFRVFEGRATPAMTARPYALWRDVLSFRFEILDNDPLPVVMQKMETGIVNLLNAPDTEMAHLIGYLAGFDFFESPHIKGLLGDAKQLTARARQLAYRFFERLGKIEPAILKLEDIHYADDASLDLFNELTAAHPDLPLTIIHLARPALLERRPAWGNAQSFHKRLTLMPLDKRESRDLARELLQKIPDPPKVLRDLLAERAEGNPLFMEELVRLMLEDRVILVEDDQWRVEETRLARLRVPPSLMGVLQTRLDTLLYSEKLILQRASVFGRTFPDSLLRAMDANDTAHVNDLTSALKTLETRGFIQRRETSSFADNVEYAFAQGMLRDMLYATLLERQRHTYHASIAAWLAKSERADEYLPLIAEHYEKAGNMTQSAIYLERAGDKATQVSSFSDAVKLYKRASNDKCTATLALKLADAHFSLGDYPAARAAIGQTQAAATNNADRASALALLGEITSQLGDYAEAQVILAQVVPLARASGDSLTLCRTLYALGDVNWRLGKPDEAQVALNESLALARTLGDVTRELFALTRLGAVMGQQGDLDEEERLYTEVHTRAAAVGNRERAMTALNNLGAVAYERRDYVAAQEYLQQALALARETGVQDAIAIFLLNLADSDIKLGQLTVARTSLHEGLALALRIGALPWVVDAVKNFGLLAHAEGQTDQALALIGLARNHPAWISDLQRELDSTLAEWALDPAVVEAGMAKGAELDWDATIQEMLR